MQMVGCSQMVNWFYKKTKKPNKTTTTTTNHGLFIQFSVRGEVRVEISGTEELCCLKKCRFLNRGVKFTGEREWTSVERQLLNFADCF